MLLITIVKVYNKKFSGAQWNLGCIYRDGDGLPANQPLAISLFQSAAEQGYPQALNYLAEVYLKGSRHLAKDVKRAVKLYQLAAEQGNPNAHYALGLCYLKGEGIELDTAQAKKYLLLAQGLGVVAATKHLSKLDNTSSTK